MWSSFSSGRENKSSCHRPRNSSFPAPRSLLPRVTNWSSNAQLLNLLHNSATAVTGLSGTPRVTIDVEVDPEEAQTVIRIVNDFSPSADRSDESSGIGLKEVEYLVEKLCSGSFTYGRDDDNGRFVAEMRLPVNICEDDDADA